MNEEMNKIGLNIKDIPENKDLINSIIILKDIYNDRISFMDSNINNIKYQIRIDDKYYYIKNILDLKILIEQYYNIKNLNGEELYNSFERLVYDYMNYKNMLDEDKTKIYLDICPLIDEFFEKYKKLKSIDFDTKKYFMELNNLNYNDLSISLSKMIIDAIDNN